LAKLEAKAMAGRWYEPSHVVSAQQRLNISQENKMTTILESKIGTMLANEHVASIEVAELIVETESALEKAHADVKTAHERKLDITVDQEVAQQGVLSAELSVSRLVGALDRLKERHNTLLLAEISSRWAARFEAVEKRRDAAVKHFNRYPELANAMAQILSEAAAVDQEVRAINAERPDGAQGYLYSVELTARGLKSFSRDEPSLAETVVLPGLWPPRSNPSAAIEMLMASPAHYYGDNWADNGTGVEKERARSREQMSKYYQEMTATQTERQNRELAEQNQARRVAR
jgi:hypothetical protein